MPTIRSAGSRRRRGGTAENAVMAYRERLLQQLNAAAGAAGPWFLGKSFSALDLYVAVMCHWRPGRAWFRQHCPRLYAIAERVEQRPELNALLSAQFDGVAPLES